MSRVSDGSTLFSVQNAIKRSKSKLEDLQNKGSSLKAISTISDDPVGNVRLLEIKSQKSDANQFTRNADLAKMQLQYSETALTELTDILVKAKEISVGMSSSLYSAEQRSATALEVEQLRQQAVSIANRRLGNKYIFGGFNTREKPFDDQGDFKGDDGVAKVQINKELYIPMNFTAKSLFFGPDENYDKLFLQEQKKTEAIIDGIPLVEKNKNEILKEEEPKERSESSEINRTLASVKEKNTDNLNTFNDQYSQPIQGRTVFDNLNSLVTSLQANDPEGIQDLLEKLDQDIDRVIHGRTRIGAIVNTIERSASNIQSEQIHNESYRSKIEDADVTQLFTDLAQQKSTLEATYKMTSNMLNNNLMDFIK